MKKKYRYVKYNKVICRFELNGARSYCSVGEIYDKRNKTWTRSLNTVEYDMSGASTVIDEKDALKLLAV